jgi:tRNA G26 N,N-dimethylase Trm1
MKPHIYLGQENLTRQILLVIVQILSHFRRRAHDSSPSYFCFCYRAQQEITGPLSPVGLRGVRWSVPQVDLNLVYVYLGK